MLYVKSEVNGEYGVVLENDNEKGVALFVGVLAVVVGKVLAVKLDDFIFGIAKGKTFVCGDVGINDVNGVDMLAVTLIVGCYLDCAVAVNIVCSLKCAAGNCENVLCFR